MKIGRRILDQRTLISAAHSNYSRYEFNMHSAVKFNRIVNPLFKMTPEKIIENSVHFINSKKEKCIMNFRAKNGCIKNTIKADYSN